MLSKIIFALSLSILFVIPASSQDAMKKGTRTSTEPVAVGDVAPDFTLNDETGKAVTLSKLKKPVVLVFYRGYW